MSKKILGLKGAVLAFLLIVSQASLTANAQNSAYGCQKKLANLETQLSYAKQHGNSNRVRGLERAIANVNSYCGKNDPAEVTTLSETNAATPAVTPTSLGKGCARKKAELQKQLSYAQQYGNSNRVRGLERAISNVNNHCNDSSLKADLEKDVAKQEYKVKKRELELEKAMSKGDASKVAKQERKLAEELEELAEKENELAAYFN